MIFSPNFTDVMASTFCWQQCVGDVDSGSKTLGNCKYCKCRQYSVVSIWQHRRELYPWEPAATFPHFEQEHFLLLHTSGGFLSQSPESGKVTGLSYMRCGSGIVDHLNETLLVWKVYENGIFTLFHLGVCETPTCQFRHKLLNLTWHDVTLESFIKPQHSH